MLTDDFTRALLSADHSADTLTHQISQALQQSCALIDVVQCDLDLDVGHDRLTLVLMLQLALRNLHQVALLHRRLQGLPIGD